MSDVTELWEDEIDIAEYTHRDFTGRGQTLSVYSDDGTLFALGDAIATKMDLNRSEAVDCVMRMYIARLLDESGNSEQREEHETIRQIPPKDWVPSRIDVDVGESDEEGQLNTYTSPVVKELLEWVRKNCSDYETQNELINDALRWYVGEVEVEDHIVT